MNHSKISIIVPVFKVEKYLQQCLDSILEQTFKEFDLILIDDGSPDLSGIICDSYANKDSRIRVLHKKNCGLMSAWISGIKMSRSPYIGFVDSDDWIEPNMYDILFTQITEKKADIVTCGIIKEYEGYYINVGKGNTLLFEGNQIKEKLIPALLTSWSQKNPTIQNSRTNKLFRRELIVNNLEYCNPKISTGEDLNIVLPALMDTNKVICLGNKYLYHYRQRNKTIIHSYNPSLIENNKHLANSLNQIISSKGYFYKEIDVFITFLFYQSLINECTAKKPIVDKIKTIRQNIRSLHDNSKFTILHDHYKTGGNITMSRTVSLFLLSKGLWFIWILIYEFLNIFQLNKYKKNLID